MASKQSSEVTDLVSNCFNSYSPDSGIEFETSPYGNQASRGIIFADEKTIRESDNSADNNEFALDQQPETSTDSGSFKYDDPLSEPIVRQSLERVHISGVQLMNMTVKELNKRLAHCPAFIISKLKRCRRTLKNRGYAKNCRVKRIALKNQLEQINMSLIRENGELRQYNKSLVRQLNQLIQTNRNIQPTSVVYQTHLDNTRQQMGYNPEAVMAANHQVDFAHQCTLLPPPAPAHNPEVPQPTPTNQEPYYLPPLESDLDYLAEQLALE